MDRWGSGKTRFAQSLASALPNAVFLGLDRLSDPQLSQRLANDPTLAEQVERRLTWLIEEGAERSDRLIHLVVALEAATSTILVIDTQKRSNPNPTAGGQGLWPVVASADWCGHYTAEMTAAE